MTNHFSAMISDFVK
ncbi:Putative uncharacterized protein [Staphylococcus xylosus]|nr:Putative uncharacterized protein [Staphylococcus xylosus]